MIESGTQLNAWPKLENLLTVDNISSTGFTMGSFSTRLSGDLISGYFPFHFSCNFPTCEGTSADFPVSANLMQAKNLFLKPLLLQKTYCGSHRMSSVWLR
jgi:hypothetical protein